MKKKIWGWFAICLLIVFAVQVIGGMWNNAATYDEVAHLPAGYAYINKGDFRFNPEHPPFVKIVAAIPLLFMKIPALEENPEWDSKNEWQFGRYFLYNSGIDADKALFHGRLMVLILGLLLAFLVFQWSKELYGIRAGVFSLFLFAFEPNLIAGSQIIHTDLGFTLFMASALYFFWKAMKIPSRIKFIFSGLFFGLALATKFTALVLFPIYFGLVILYLFERNGTITFRRFLFKKDDRLSLRLRLYFILFTFPLLLLTALIVLAACYGFSSIYRYMDGLQFVLNHNHKGNPSFLFGLYSDFGWWYYFPLAFLIKTPLPIIVFLILSFFLFLKERFRIFFRTDTGPVTTNRQHSESEPNLYNELYLLFPAFLFISISLLSNINIGVRHILPIYPLFIIFSGRFIYHFFASKKTVPENALVDIQGHKKQYNQKEDPVRRSAKENQAFLSCIGPSHYSKRWIVVTIVLMIWLVSSSVFIFPYHLSYFNELVLGPKHGYKYLVDSNLDWGQDLIRLKKFLDKEGEDSLILSYLGSADPNYYDIKYQYLPGYGLNHPQDYEIKYNQKEFLALSATNLQSVFFNLHDAFDWLKEKRPYAQIGYSIFVWEISQDAYAHQNLARLYKEFGMSELSLKHFQKAQKLLRKD